MGGKSSQGHNLFLDRPLSETGSLFGLLVLLHQDKFLPVKRQIGPAPNLAVVGKGLRVGIRGIKLPKRKCSDRE